MRKSIPMCDTWQTCKEATAPPRRLHRNEFPAGYSLARLLSSRALPPLSQPDPLCNHKSPSVEQFSADGMCLTDAVSQNRPQSTIDCEERLPLTYRTSN